jgi:hypothetical protein
VFVSSSLGDDANEGTKERPLRTLSAAMVKAAADAKPLYACAETFNEAVVLEAGIDVFGGLECANGWRWIGETTKTTLAAGSDQIPLTLTASASGALVADFAIEAADAMTDGGSSIAMVVDGATAALVRCDVRAGNGMPGAKGETPTDSVGPTDPTDPEIKGNDGAAACMAPDQQFGGAAKENSLCPVASGGPLGGAGGNGTLIEGGAGGAQTANSQTAQGGAGQPSTDPMNLWSCAVGMGLGGGNTGSNGAPGDPGAGANDAASLGTLSSTGYTGLAGQPGLPGAPGQGGGGGGGAKGKPTCAGASGGGGGAGGCGGNGGLGGQAGGASIGIVSLGATLTFDTVTIRTGNGADGGEGGDGQGGGIGGLGGTGGLGDSNAPATLAACGGGNGGQGGTGGKGGGGRGGHAIGIAHTGAAPAIDGVTIETGTLGSGGTGADADHNGAPGVKANVQEFP